MISNSFSTETLAGELENVHLDFTRKLSRFSKAEINKAPGDEAWTAGQVTEHIIKSNEGIIKELLQGDATATERPFDGQVDLIKNIFRGEDKMKTAPVLEPGKPPHDLDYLLEVLQKQNAQQLEIVKSKDLKELSSNLKFPPAPNGLTRYEWLIFMIEHTRRHGKQLEKIFTENSK